METISIGALYIPLAITFLLVIGLGAVIGINSGKGIKSVILWQGILATVAVLFLQFILAIFANF